MRRRPTVFQIQEAIMKNICAPGEDEKEEYTISRFIRASTKREGDSQLGIVLFIGICTHYGYLFSDIASMASIEREEFVFKLNKYRRKARSNDKRFVNKIKLIKNYLSIVYGA